MFIIKGRLIDAVSDEAIDKGLVAIQGDRIVYAGMQEGCEIEQADDVLDLPGKTIMPGMIDAHAHLTASESVNQIGKHPYDMLLTAAYDLSVLVDAGVTGVRDMSVFGVHLKNAVEKGILKGPRIMPGARVLSISSGHADFDVHRTVQDINRESLISYLVDGCEECLRGVRQMFREGAEFIKLCATGGVSSSIDKVDDVQFSNEELRVIVEEAQRHGTYVAAHCTGTSGTKQAILAGVKSIEHGIMLDEECIQLMLQRDLTLVTTLSVALGLQDMKALPEHIMRKAHGVAEQVTHSYEMAHAVGIRVALGTDYSNSPNTPFNEIGKEFYSLTRVGYSPMEAIKAGTANGAYLMMASDRFGKLEKGKLADLVVVDGNPLEDIRLLADSNQIKLVMIGGRIWKNTLTEAL